jgi:ornithine carbamoyltransferase
MPAATRAIRHLTSLKDYTNNEVLALVKRSLEIKSHMKQGIAFGQPPMRTLLQGKALGMVFSKRSTRTRLSAETGWGYYGGNAVYLGKDDMQLGAGEPIQDTTRVLSSMVDMIFARLGDHEELLVTLYISWVVCISYQ